MDQKIREQQPFGRKVYEFIFALHEGCRPLSYLPMLQARIDKSRGDAIVEQLTNLVLH